jgi:hypothetical protein
MKNHPEFINILEMLTFLVQNSKIANCFMDSKYFLPSQNKEGNYLEYETLLGRIIRYSE